MPDLPRRFKTPEGEAEFIAAYEATMQLHDAFASASSCFFRRDHVRGSCQPKSLCYCLDDAVGIAVHRFVNNCGFQCPASRLQSCYC